MPYEIGAQLPKPKVFISYARKDMEFADRLVAALEARGLEVAIDRRDLPLLEEWQNELIGFIRAADAVIFLVSPASIVSKWCEWEVAQVNSLNKRLAPVVIEAVTEGIPEAIRKINLLFFTPPNEFQAQADKLAKALNTDIGWIKEHTRLGERARRWEEGERADALLLRGHELADAESWILRRPPEAPRPTELHREFVHESRKSEQARAEKELEQIARTRRFQKRSAWALAGVAVLVLGGLGASMWQSRQTEIREAAVMTSLAQQGNVDGLHDRAMRIALQGLPPLGPAPWSAGWDHKVIRGLEAKLAGAVMMSRIVARFDHAAPVWTAAFSSDGARVVTAPKDCTARIFDVSSGEEIATLRGHSGQVESAAFSPDGTRVLTTSEDQTARIWDAKSGHELTAFKQLSSGWENRAAFSPDGVRVVLASLGNTASVWDLASGKERAVLKGHTGELTSVAFSPDGTSVITSARDNTARIWDASTGKSKMILGGLSAIFSPDGTRVLAILENHTANILDSTSGMVGVVLRGHSGPVVSAAFSPDGTRIVTASQDKTARIWNAATGKEIGTLEHANWVSSAKFSPDSTQVITTSDDVSARIWDSTSGTLNAVLKGHTNDVRLAAFSPDGSLIVTAAGGYRSEDRTVRIWNAVSNEPSRTSVVLDKTIGRATSAAFSPDGTRIVIAYLDDTARILSVATGKELATLIGHTSDVMSAAFSRDGRRIITASFDSVRTWDAASGSPHTTLIGHTFKVTSAAFSPDATRILTTSDDDTVRIWDAETGRQRAALNGSEGVFSSDGARIVTLADDDTVRTWNADTGRQEAILTGKSAAFSPNGAWIVTSDENQPARVWDAASGNAIVFLNGPKGSARSPAFSPDGALIVTTSQDFTARIWDAASGQQRAALKGHMMEISEANFSPDGARVVTASADGSVRIWDAASGKEIIKLEGHIRAVNAAFSPDGARVVSTASQTDDTTTRIWDVRWATRMRGYELREAVCSGKLIGVLQAFTSEETDDPVLDGLQGTRPCDRRGPLSLLYWTRLPGKLWAIVRGALIELFSRAFLPNAPPAPSAS